MVIPYQLSNWPNCITLRKIRSMKVLINQIWLIQYIDLKFNQFSYFTSSANKLKKYSKWKIKIQKLDVKYFGRALYLFFFQTSLPKVAVTFGKKCEHNFSFKSCPIWYWEFSYFCLFIETIFPTISNKYLRV
jgi:hypothetical protein